MEAVVQADAVGKRFGAKWALRGFSFRVEPGEIVGLLGANGAGKTTTVKLLLNLLFADEGSVELDGRPATDPASRARVGYSPEQPLLPSYLTLRQFLRFHADLAQTPRERFDPAALAGRAGIAAVLDRKISTFSKGMMQRACLAAAMIGDPAILLLDEPTSGLDPVGRKEVRDLLLSLRKEGKAILLNSHLLSEVETCCDRMLILRDGTLAAEGTLDQLTKKGCRVELRVQRETPELLADLARLAISVQPQNGAIVLELPGDGVIPEVAALVAKHGCGLLSLQPVRDSLEDVFHRLIGATGSPGAVGDRS